MDKIYCKNCHFVYINISDKVECTHPICFETNGIKKIDTPFEKVKQVERKRKLDMDINYLNRDNNCKYYKRKWWKFWVK